MSGYLSDTYYDVNTDVSDDEGDLRSSTYYDIVVDVFDDENTDVRSRAIGRSVPYAALLYAG